MKKKKSFDFIFLIRRTDILGNKDIDHYLPFFYFLNKSKKIDFTARGLVFDKKNVFLKSNDQRVKLLSNLKGITLHFITETFFASIIKKYKLLSIENNWPFSKLMVKILSKLYNLFDSKFICSDKSLGKKFIHSKNPVILSLYPKEHLEILSKIKKINKKIKIIELTHGTLICENEMVLDTDMGKKIFKQYDKNYKKIDFFLRTSKKEVYQDIKRGIKKNRSYAIGSPRYCKEWLKVKYNLKLDGKKVEVNGKFKIKILFLMPKQNINIFWDEVIRTIDFISSYSEFELIILNYNNYSTNIPKNIKRRNNIRFYLISKNYSTSKLIDWSDIVFHSGTGVIFEAFLKEKITVFPRYLTSNSLISEIYGAGCNLKNRDELRNFCNEALVSLKELKKNYFKKNKINNKKFVNDFVYVNSKSISKNIEVTLYKIF